MRRAGQLRRVTACALAALIPAAVAAGCGDDAPAAPATSDAVTTGAPTSIPAARPAPTAPTTTSPATTLDPASGATTATEALAPLRAELESIRLAAVDVAGQVEQGPVAAGAPEPPPELDRRATALAGRYWQLVRRLPPGLDPQVRTAAMSALFALGRLMAPFLRASGWRPVEWATVWKPTVDDGRVSAARALTALDTAARNRPRLAPVDPAGADAAAQAALAQVLASRAFALGEFTLPPRAALAWVGALPEGAAGGSAGSDCAAAWTARLALSGGFEPGRGGCAVVALGTDDASTRSRDIAAFLADPGARLAGSPLDLVTVRADRGRWTATSSLGAA